jgi:glucose-6-phosphate 1-epimerase
VPAYFCDLIFPYPIFPRRKKSAGDCRIFQYGYNCIYDNVCRSVEKIFLRMCAIPRRRQQRLQLKVQCMDAPVFSSGPGPAERDEAQFPQELLGLPCLFLSCGDARAAVAQQGAQVLSWRDAGGRERLYLSSQTGGAQRGADAGVMAAAIRGGIPLCFPQFSGRGPLLKHGFARASLWACADKDKAAVTLTLHDDTRSRMLWPESFEAEVSVLLQKEQLRVTLAVSNRGDTPWEFTTALHSYLRVDDIARTQLAGLQHTRYQDATAGNVETVERAERLEICGELDRVYLSPPPMLQLLENGRPSLRIEQSGFADTVVWNPGPANARLLADFPDHDWRHMLCVEAACAAAPVLLQPGQTWRGTQILSALPA